MTMHTSQRCSLRFHLPPNSGRTGFVGELNSVHKTPGLVLRVTEI
jgi:hypothetical protein